MDIIQPQLVLIYNKERKIKRAVILSYFDVKKTSYIYNIITLYSNKFLNKEEVLKGHVMLTCNLATIRGYLQNILNIKEKIILYSIFNNIDYQYPSGDIFNPFNIKKDSIIRTNSDSTCLYEIYKDVSYGAVFCILEESEFYRTDLMRDGLYNKVYVEYLDKIMNNIKERNFEIESNTKESKIYKTNINNSDIMKLLKLEKYYKVFCLYSKYDIYCSGNKLTLLDNLDKTVNLILIFKDDDRKIFVLQDNNFNTEYIEELDLILKENNIEIKRDKNKTNFITIINLDSYLPPKININHDFNFFIEETPKTRNIFVDPSVSKKKISIITSKKHITFMSKYNFKNLAEYMSIILLGYINIENKLENLKPKIKLDTTYISRLCQDSIKKNVYRKPILINSEQIEDYKYNKVNDLYYEGKINNDMEQHIKKGTKKIYEDFRYGDIYIDPDGLHYKCRDRDNIKDNPFIGFVEGALKTYQICIPCCYSNSKTETSSFKKCVYDEDEQIDQFNPYINKNNDKIYRILLDKSKLGHLSLSLNEILNFNSKININKQSRINSAEDYSVYMTNDEIVILSNFEQIYDFIKKNIYCIIVTSTNILYNKKLVELYFENNITKLTVYLLIQNRLHIIKNISKKENESKITVTELKKEQLDSIMNLVKNINIFNFERKSNGLKISNNNFYIDNNKININLESKYLVRFNNIHKELNTISNYVYDNYVNIYSNYIYSDNVELFKKICLTNVLSMIDEENIISNKENIERIDKKMKSLFSNISKFIDVLKTKSFITT